MGFAKDSFISNAKTPQKNQFQQNNRIVIIHMRARPTWKVWKCTGSVSEKNRGNRTTKGKAWKSKGKTNRDDKGL